MLGDSFAPRHLCWLSQDWNRRNCEALNSEVPWGIGRWISTILQHRSKRVASCHLETSTTFSIPRSLSYGISSSTSMSQLSSPTMSKSGIVRQSCDACGKSHVRCQPRDGQACVRCHEKGLSCNFSMSKRGLPKPFPSPCML